MYWAEEASVAKAIERLRIDRMSMVFMTSVFDDGTNQGFTPRRRGPIIATSVSVSCGNWDWGISIGLPPLRGRSYGGLGYVSFRLDLFEALRTARCGWT